VRGERHHSGERAIETEGEIDLRSFLGIDPAVKRGYDALRARTVRPPRLVHPCKQAYNPFYNDIRG